MRKMPAAGRDNKAKRQNKNNEKDTVMGKEK
jgi:hypothetical protein